MFIRRFNTATLILSLAIWGGGILLRMATLGIFTHAGYLEKLLQTALKHPAQFVGGIGGWTLLVIGGAFLIILLTEKKRNRESSAVIAERLANIM